ncbi:Dynein light chain Tctex-type [Cichlidogyrus casuarinus]|uniref:Dynein light chain Tctex-type n=1 Tax=Cichlidogyrus casuarinus TaxID=1844966 RepID=A0ABD2PJH0_9PLAT
MELEYAILPRLGLTKCFVSLPSDLRESSGQVFKLDTLEVVYRIMHTTRSASGNTISSSISINSNGKHNAQESNDNLGLRTWKASIVVPLTSVELVLHRIWNQRHLWDPELFKAEIIQELDDSVQFYRVVLTANAPQPSREWRLLRGKWMHLEASPTAISFGAVVSESFQFGEAATQLADLYPDHPQALMPTSHVFHEHFYVETLPKQPSDVRISLISKCDLRGFGLEYYRKQWGFAVMRRLLNLAQSLHMQQYHALDSELHFGHRVFH